MVLAPLALNVFNGKGCWCVMEGLQMLDWGITKFPCVLSKLLQLDDSTTFVGALFH